jgi:DNA-binding response OmpR family regulator
MQKTKILLIDDTTDMLTIGQRIFERAGYDFIFARSGEEGLKKVTADRPSCIILDYLLPDMHGSQFIKILATDAQYALFQDIPIIVLTAHPNASEELEDCFKMGLHACLYKPFGHRELVNVVENIIRRTRIEKESDATGRKPSASQDVTWLEDLKISFSTINSLCKELTMGDKSNLSDRQRTDLNAIYNTSKRLAHLVNRNTAKVTPH